MVEHGKRGVRVNCVNPGLVDTPLIAPLVDRLARQAGVSHDEASFVTGAILDVDGGTTSVNPGMLGYQAAYPSAAGRS